MRIELLYFEGCPNDGPTEALVREVLTELGIGVTVERVEVADDESAQRLQFVGSPTVRIDGQDIDPENAVGGYGMKCRLYRDGSGQLVGVPPRDQVRSALQGARP